MGEVVLLSRLLCFLYFLYTDNEQVLLFQWKKESDSNVFMLVSQDWGERCCQTNVIAIECVSARREHFLSCRGQAEETEIGDI